MTLGDDAADRGMCYFRNLVARCYREARYLGTAGTYESLETYYPACRRKLEVGRDWVEPVLRDTRSMANPTDIESYFALRLDGLSLKQLLEAFEQGSWGKNIGGTRWAVIVQATLDLGRAVESGNSEAVRSLLDSIDDLQHNTRRVVSDFLEPC